MTRFGYKKTAIGEGLAARVYPAFRLDDDGHVVAEGFAMKRLHHRWRESEQMVGRFKREAQIQQEQLDHPNVLPVVARNLSADPPYFVMPLATHSLKDAIADGLHERNAEALDIFRQILEAMAHAHERDVLHRDLKPSNVLFVDGHACVSDFGFGKLGVADATELTETNQWFGSRHYMAPEQLTPKEGAATCDVYALGKILGELLTGVRPEPFIFDADQVPTRYRYFLRRCCDNDPAKRYQTAGDALDAFRVLTSASEIIDPPLEGAEKLVQQWMTAPVGEDLAHVRALDEHYRRYGAEEELYSRTVPKLPELLRAQYAAALPDEFRAFVETYDGHIDGPLAFEYCDVVANFYAALAGERRHRG